MKIAISEISPCPAAFPTDGTVTLSAGTISQAGFPEHRCGLKLWRHDLSAGGEIVLSRPAEDHVFYVLSGQVTVGELAAPAEGAVCVACNAAAVLVAGPTGARLLHYVGDAATRPDKPGGCVHVLEARGIHATVQDLGQYVATRTIYADSACATCSVWLHKSSDEPHRFYAPHTHSTDEVISVLEGSLALGRQALRKGQAAAIPGGAYYSFVTGPEGLTFLNFRQDEPMTLKKGGGEWTSDRERMMSRATRPGVRRL